MPKEIAVAQRPLQPFKSSFTVADGDAAYNTSAEVAALVEAK